MNRNGYATLALDRIGTGKSSRPPAALATLNTNAHTVHDAVQAARGGQLPGGSYSNITLGGHSYGTYTAWLESALYSDVDGVIATGASHIPGAIGLGYLETQLEPAKQAPPGYVTISDAARSKFFYEPGNIDPNVVRQDKRLKSPESVVALETLASGLAVTPKIDVPTLVANGQKDMFYCAQGDGLSLVDCTNSETFKRVESKFYSPKAQVEAYILPDAGHSMNLALNAGEWYKRALQWHQKYFPLAK